MALALIVSDSCSLINLVATGRIVEVLNATSLRLLACQEAIPEIRHTLGPIDENGDRIKVPIDLTALRAAHLLEVALASDVGADTLVKCVELGLRDVDATGLALAICRGLPLLSDDNKIRKIATNHFSAVRLYSTLGLLKEASGALGWSADTIRQVLEDLRMSANFLAPKADPDRTWGQG